MVLKTLKYFFIFSSFFLASCSLLEPGWSVLRGSTASYKGDYQKALVFYLRQSRSRRYREIVLYDIAEVYYALGEGKAALEIWKDIQESSEKVVVFSAAFNRGVAAYQEESFLEAYHAFRQALELEPASLDAKKNLELTIERLEAESRSRGDRSSPESEAPDDVRRILQYIKRKEGSPWLSKQEESGAAQDW